MSFISVFQTLVIASVCLDSVPEELILIEGQGWWEMSHCNSEYYSHRVSALPWEPRGGVPGKSRVLMMVSC